jgi:hypothetical protein
VEPLLPVERFVAYQAALGLTPSTGERVELRRLPQFFADRLGWKELAETVAGVYHALPPEDQQRACVFGQNYGQAGAIDFYGPPLGLPHAISGHNSYHVWGPRGCSGELVMVIGDGHETLDRIFGSVELAATTHCPDCMPYEDDLSIWVCREPKVSLSDLWCEIGTYI